MQSVSSDYFDYYFGWENSRLGRRGPQHPELSSAHAQPQLLACL